jgi:hypothetical protein
MVVFHSYVASKLLAEMQTDSASFARPTSPRPGTGFESTDPSESHPNRLLSALRAIQIAVKQRFTMKTLLAPNHPRAAPDKCLGRRASWIRRPPSPLDIPCSCRPASPLAPRYWGPPRVARSSRTSPRPPRWSRSPPC